MNDTDASDYSPLAFGTGLALGLMLIFGLPRATNEPLSAPLAEAGSDVRAETVERVAADRTLALADPTRH